MTVSALKYKIAYLLLIIFASHGNEIYKKIEFIYNFTNISFLLEARLNKDDLCSSHSK